MSPNPRTPQQRDRRFARVRRLTRTIFLGSGVLSGALVGYVASNAKPVIAIPVAATTTTTTTAPTSESANNDDATPTTTPYTPPASAPVTTTTVCTTSPSGTTTCY
jgi:phosphoribosylcarboxyaminoimidazole (NCAIR) mutase